MIEITFHNKTTKIESCTISKEGKEHHFQGKKAKEICSMAANSGNNDLKRFIDSLQWI